MQVPQEAGLPVLTVADNIHACLGLPLDHLRHAALQQRGVAFFVVGLTSILGSDKFEQVSRAHQTAHVTC